jgi:hypothetical protein
MYSPHWNSLEIKGATRNAMGANKDPRKPPLCKTIFFFWRLMDFLARVLKPALFLLSLIFCVWVNFTLPLKLLSAHSHTHSTKLWSALAMICLLMQGLAFYKYNKSLAYFLKRGDIMLPHRRLDHNWRKCCSCSWFIRPNRPFVSLQGRCDFSIWVCPRSVVSCLSASTRAVFRK